MYVVILCHVTHEGLTRQSHSTRQPCLDICYSSDWHSMCTHDCTMDHSESEESGWVTVVIDAGYTSSRMMNSSSFGINDQTEWLSRKSASTVAVSLTRSGALIICAKLQQ